MGPINPFRPESLYCLAHSNIYNANAFCGSIGGHRYYTRVA